MVYVAVGSFTFPLNSIISISSRLSLSSSKPYNLTLGVRRAEKQNELQEAAGNPSDFSGCCGYIHFPKITLTSFYSLSSGTTTERGGVCRVTLASPPVLDARCVGQFVTQLSVRHAATLCWSLF